ncbi:hypothetical protein CH373_12190 [Leptospira perolatii]|uniref:Transport permease protein n=1 Tax=Leptospira perolatii TaxID=2023191 RepID=A0A2M9ZL69_9LEPT|nr:ABC transporter permease [Leptospira perolatii]PJZ70300.1 hypothetical protein CH360_06780 [Leptospira perolatii]PJZ72816.1 hypothetical protein CH373_12190 [Leptospira perolatii]
MGESKSLDHYEILITPENKWYDINLSEIFGYRYLIWLFVKRDFVTFYKQTILGPVWYLLQPVFTTGVFTIVFGAIARVPTDGINPILFYFSGSVIWGYFSETLLKNSNTFTQNAALFGKVYFPRLVVAISTTLIFYVRLFLQFGLLAIIFLVFFLRGEAVQPKLINFLLLPLILLQLGLFSLGAGILISSFTTKYKDLAFVLGFGIQLFMYASPIVYPASIVPKNYLDLYLLNPIASIVEQFRFVLFNTSILEAYHFAYSWLATLLILLLGLIAFHKVEKNFMDTI